MRRTRSGVPLQLAQCLAALLMGRSVTFVEDRSVIELEALLIPQFEAEEHVIRLIAL